MKQYILRLGLFPFCIFLIFTGCQQSSAIIESTYKHFEPTYRNIQLIPQGDSLHFPLEENSYNYIGSFNYFTHKGKPFIAFYDRDAQSLNTYDFMSRQLVHKIPLKKWLVGEKMKKASTFVFNFDSIVVITDNKLFLLDSSSVIKKNIELFEPMEERAYCDNETPALLKGGVLYTGVKASLNDASIKAQRRWKVLCSFNLLNDTKELYYQLSPIYRKNLYGYPFLEYSYCVNDRGNFVFSFPADTNIYETNLADVHNAYYAKSQFQMGTITSVPIKLIENKESFKQYSFRDSYGTIYYDPYKKRYMRLAKQKINEADFLAKKRERKRSIIIFDEQFKIIGESLLDNKFEFKFIFFTPNGIYARVKFSDEQALHFVRLDYVEGKDGQIQIAQGKNKL